MLAQRVYMHVRQRGQMCKEGQAAQLTVEGHVHVYAPQVRGHRGQQRSTGVVQTLKATQPRPLQQASTGRLQQSQQIARLEYNPAVFHLRDRAQLAQVLLGPTPRDFSVADSQHPKALHPLQW